MPTLAVTSASAPGRTNGAAATAAQIRAAITSTSAGSLRSSHRITNSSPAMRARVSPERSAAVSRCGDGDEQLVADAVAVEVVHQLEPVEIQEQDRGHLAGPSAA